jgi:hypothetical protein
VPVTGTRPEVRDGLNASRPRQRSTGRRKPAMEDFIKFLMLVGAIYSAYRSTKTAWRLGAELFG